MEGVAGRDDRAAWSRPAGWFAVAFSDGLGASDVVSTHAFGDRQVVYRGESGRVFVFDAFCPHQGADLAVGGWVKGDDLVCPFHAWRWDCGGRNVEIPYSQNVNRSRRLRGWPVREQDGLVYVWHDPAGGEPAWEPPSIPEIGGTVTRRIDVIRVTPQMVVETALDAPHAGTAYGEPLVSDGVAAEGSWLAAQYGGGAVAVEVHGVGVVVHRRRGPQPLVWAMLATPLDHELSEVRTVVATPDEDRVAETVWRRLETDMAIWEHQWWTAQALDPDEDAVLAAVRRWSGRFYPVTV